MYRMYVLGFGYDHLGDFGNYGNVTDVITILRGDLRYRTGLVTIDY